MEFFQYNNSKMIALSVVLCVISTILLYIYWSQYFSHSAKLINKFPSAWPLTPIIGNIWRLSLKQDELYLQIRELLGRFKETFSLWAGPYPVLMVVTADDAEIILSNIKHIDKGMTYEIFSEWLNTGLLTSTGPKWHQRRKMLTPAFHYNILQMFVDIFGEKCEELNKVLRDESKKTKTNIIPIITKMTLSTICETSMGVKLKENDKNMTTYYNAVHSITEVYIKRLLLPWLYIEIVYKCLPIAWREKRIVKYLHKFTSDIIDTREKTFNINDVQDLESSNIKPTKRLAMLDLLLYAKRHLGQIDDEGIREEVDTFVFEGHDTTFAGICFALVLIANHKDVQEKIVAELDEIFGDSKRHATYEDLSNMKYLECCLKESLRLYPSVPYIVRNIKEDVPLTHHVAPAGTDIWFHIYNIHRDPKYYPDPEKFDPDRFLPENTKGRHPYTYIPFSAGSRNCIGQKFAMLELKSVVSSILRNFVMEPVDSLQDLTFIIDIILRTKGPINIKFKPRYETSD